MTVRTALVALIAFMPTSPNGALGSLDYKKEDRRALAIKSREASPKFGTPERQKLIDEVNVSLLFFLQCMFIHNSLCCSYQVKCFSLFLPGSIFLILFTDCTLSSQIHDYMLSKANPVPQPSPSQASEEPKNEEAETQVTLPNPEALPAGEGIPDEAGDRIVEEQEVPVIANPNPAGVEATNEIQPGVPSNQLPPKSETRVQNLKPETRVQKPDDRLFTVAAIGLAIAIMVLLLKKFIKSTEHGAVFMNES